MKHFPLLTFWVVLSQPGLLAAEWPTYRHDHSRSGTTPEQLDATALRTAWTWQSPTPPQPAWAGPAKWDAYAGIRGLRSMRNYDPVFHPIIAAGCVYFGSSADDSIRCLEAGTGEVRWTFTTDGPIRIAPAYSEGRLYFGSDDGAAYCLDAQTGKQVWKFAPVEPGRLIVHNGRFIPLWPIRTGVVVTDGTAYFAAGMLPWDSAYLCAVDAATGQPTGEGRFVREVQNTTFEGPLLVTSTRLIAPQGRVAPLLFDRQTGEPVGQLSGGGGIFALVTEDGELFHGPGNKTGWLTASDPNSANPTNRLAGTTAMVAGEDTLYLLSDRELRAVQREDRSPEWIQPNEHSLELIRAGDTLFAGGVGSVVAVSTQTGERLANLPVFGKAYGLAVSDGALVVSTDEGQITCFRPTGGPPDPVPSPLPRDTEAGLIGPPPAIVPIEDESLMGRWVFQRDTIDAGQVRDLAGSCPGEVKGELRFGQYGQAEGVEFDGANTHVLGVGEQLLEKLPWRELTAMGWVRVDEPRPWGGIIGALQDNGAYERGWLLGYVEDRFSMALSGQEGAGNLTYLRARTPFRRGGWYHVAGVYDGELLKLYINGELEVTSDAQQGDINYPPKAEFVIGAYLDDDEFFPLKGALNEVRIYDRALSAAAIAREFGEKHPLLPEAEKTASGSPTVAVGPYLHFTEPGVAIIRYRTREPSPTVLDLLLGEGLAHEHRDLTPKTEHEVTLTGLRRDTQYDYRILLRDEGTETWTGQFECDTFFNLAIPPLDPEGVPFPASAMAERLLAASDAHPGICLVIGCEDIGFLYDLARRSRLRVVGVDTDMGKVAEARHRLLDAGCYGSRITVRHIKDYDHLPFTEGFANVVVAPGLPESAELKRMVRPDGGVLFTGNVEQPTWTRGSLPGAGEWSHLYARPDNSAYGGEALGGVGSTNDLEVQWLGQPGPRAQPDRNGRKPSPLAVKGRLFVQGLQRLIALDAHNGSILWSLEIPPLGRFNMPRDCNNWCADAHYVYVAIHELCWKIDAQTGRVVDFLPREPGPRDDWAYDWGYLARDGDLLLGSAVKRGTMYTSFWGGADEGWYDATHGPATDKVCSDSLFALDPTSGSTHWEYQGGVISNTTITVAEGKVYFVECRQPDVLKGEERRLGSAEFWQEQYLVALDRDTGVKLWEKPIDTDDGVVMLSLAHANGKLVLVTSRRSFHTYAFDGTTGEPLWQRETEWLNRGDHGGHMSRPAVVGGKVYVRPRVLDLATGEVLPETMPWGKCGTYACTDGSLIFRGADETAVTVWNRAEAKATWWPRLRPDCWVSTIPACGLLLSPEGGGGCSCGTWLETSIAFRPKR